VEIRLILACGGSTPLFRFQPVEQVTRRLPTCILSQSEQYGQRTSGKVKAGNPALSYLGFKPGLDEL
jgi:hypothetical protein